MANFSITVLRIEMGWLSSLQNYDRFGHIYMDLVVAAMLGWDGYGLDSVISMIH